MNLASIRALDAELRSLAADERKGLVLFLHRLDLLDREQAFAEFNCGSAFDYLVRKLHLPEGTAWARVNAMRLLRRFPQLEPTLEDGRLNPTQLIVLGPVLSPENVDELVQRAAHLTKEKTKELVVSIRPREVPADGLRKLPSPTPKPASRPEAAAPYVPEVTHLDVGLRICALANHAPAERAPADEPVRTAARAEQRSQIEPVAAERWQWRIGLDRTRKEKVERLRGLLAHKIPGGSLELLFDQMVEDSLEKHGKRLGFIEPGRPRPAPEKPATPGERAPVPLPVRRAVLKRDGYRCTWVGLEGERCPCTSRLEMDHLDPAKETGSSTEADLTTRCRVHNQYRARQRYGARYVQRRIEDDRRAREARRVARASSRQATLCEQVAPWAARPPGVRAAS